MVIKQEFTFPSSDGVHTVAAAWWRPEGPPRGVVQLVHGISEHIGRYDSFARFLAEHGFAVVGHDHLGHGRTARNPSEFGWFADRDGWKHVVKDVRALRERVGAEYPGLPCFLLGHSMGSFVVRGYLMFWPGTVDGAILSGTGQEPPATVAAGRALSALLIRLKGPRAHSALLDALSVGRYNGQFKPVRTSADWISRDTVVVDTYRADPLCRFLPTVGMYHDMMVGLQLLAKPANLARMDPDTPVYFFAACPPRVSAQPGRPLGLSEAHQHEVLPYQNGALDQHTVGGQQGELLILAHAGQLVLQGQGLVLQAAGVEKTLEGQAAEGVPAAQLRLGGVLGLDVPHLSGQAPGLQPRLGLLAGGALGVTDKQHGNPPFGIQLYGITAFSP